MAQCKGISPSPFRCRMLSGYTSRSKRKTSIERADWIGRFPIRLETDCFIVYYAITLTYTMNREHFAWVCSLCPNWFWVQRHKMPYHSGRCSFQTCHVNRQPTHVLFCKLVRIIFYKPLHHLNGNSARVLLQKLPQVSLFRHGAHATMFNRATILPAGLTPNW